MCHALFPFGSDAFGFTCCWDAFTSCEHSPVLDIKQLAFAGAQLRQGSNAYYLGLLGLCTLKAANPASTSYNRDINQHLP